MKNECFQKNEKKKEHRNHKGNDYFLMIQMKLSKEKDKSFGKRRKYSAPRVTHEDRFARTSLASCTQVPNQLGCGLTPPGIGTPVSAG